MVLSIRGVELTVNTEIQQEIMNRLRRHISQREACSPYLLRWKDLRI